MKSIEIILKNRFEEGVAQMGYIFKETNEGYYKVTGAHFTRWYSVSLNKEATKVVFTEYTYSSPDFQFVKEIVTEEDLIQAIEEFLLQYATSLN